MAFMKFENEEEATQKGAFYAIVVITIALASLSVSGVFATATWSLASAPIIIFFAACVLGAEVLAAMALVRVMLATTRLRKIVGSLIFAGLAWVCVQNAKNGVHFIFPDRFAESSSTLAAKARLAGEEADQLGGVAQTAAAATPAELERVRTQMADLRVEQRKMAAQSPEGIKEAQALLLAQGKYYGAVDGLRQNLTEAAMRARGEEISGELAILAERERGLTSGAASPVQSATTDRRLSQIETEAAASEAFWAGLWLEVMLWVLEGARSFGLWVFVTAATAAGTSRIRDLKSEIEVAGLEAELAKVRANIAEAGKPQTPGPVVGADEFVEKVEEVLAGGDPPKEEAPPEELTAAQRRARKGGQSAQHAKRAAKNEKKIPVTDDRAEDEMFFDEQKVAAQ